MAIDSFVPPPKSAPFRVLSLDGGGARGYLTVRILENIEHYINVKTDTTTPLGQRFDLLVGTSTGGIIALALSINRTANEIAKFYATFVPRIFSEKSQRSRLLQYLKPKYSTDAIKKALDEQFGDATLEDAKVDVCITGVALASGRPRFYKSLYQPRYLDRQTERLSDIALATSAAPTYFKAHRLKYSSNIIDGGICANNPALVAIVDALNFERPSMTSGVKAQGLADIKLLSVGTGEQPKMPYDEDEMADAGLLGWAKHISDVMFESQSVAIDFQAQHLLPAGQYLRINPKLGSAFLLDELPHLHDLNNYASITDEYASKINRFFDVS